MGDIQVSAENHRLFFLKALQIGKKRILPLHPVWQTQKSVLRIRRVYLHHIVILKFRRNDTPLLIMLAASDPVGNADRFLLREQGRPGIALLHRVIPILMIAGKLQGNLSLLKLRFLYTKNICIRQGEEIHKPLLHTGAQTIHIP